VAVLTHLFASVPVADRDAAMRWYERLLGRAPDLLPNDHEAAWQLTDGGWIYVIADPPRAGTALHTLLVDDLDAFLAEAARRGVRAGPVQSEGAAARSATIADPDGNRVKLGEPLTGAR
jgi:predicted enzyme related to lactoylglutathione lyase